MKNMFGDDVEPRKITFRWLIPHLDILVNGHWQGMVSPNGWQGHSMDINHKLGEPVMSNVHLWQTLSFSEMAAIMEEYNKHMDNTRAMQIVIGAIAKEKKISFDAALALVKKKNIPTIA